MKSGVHWEDVPMQAVFTSFHCWLWQIVQMLCFIKKVVCSMPSSATCGKALWQDAAPHMKSEDLQSMFTEAV